MEEQEQPDVGIEQQKESIQEEKPTSMNKKIVVAIVVLGIFIVGIYVYVNFIASKEDVEQTSSTSPYVSRFIGGGYTKKENIVRYNGEIIEVDAQTFEFLGDPSVAKDNFHVYVSGMRVGSFGTDQEFDLDTFEYLGRDFMRDKNALWYLDASNDLKKVEGADPAMVGDQIKDRLPHPYLYDENQAWYITSPGYGSFRNMIPLEGITFPLTVEKYVFDEHIFYLLNDLLFFRTHELKNINIENITYLNEGLSKSHITDGILVYYVARSGFTRFARQLEGANPTTLRIMDVYYAADEDTVYWMNEKLDYLEGKSFKTLNYFYRKDANTVIFQPDGTDHLPRPIIVEGADAATFTVDSGSVARDKDYMYRYGERVEQ